MQLRILTWNIKFFASSKIRNANQAALIVNTARTAAVAADIFIVVEVHAGSAGVAEPLYGSGARAVVSLAAVLAARPVSGSATPWRLVPPFGLTDSRANEGIAVLYNSDKVEFLGPVTFDYKDSIFQGLEGPAKAKLAGQCKFFDSNKKEIWFPLSRNRRPWLVTFQTRESIPTKFSILAFHAAPIDTSKSAPKVADQECVKGTEALATITPVTSIGIVTGDFNCNTYDDDYKLAFGPLERAGYTRQFNEVPSSCKEVFSATPSDYLGLVNYDNFLTKNIGVNPTHSVVDPVAGTPSGYPKLPAYARNQYTPSDIPVNVFRAKENYACVRGTSDHLPLYMVVTI